MLCSVVCAHVRSLHICVFSPLYCISFFLQALQLLKKASDSTLDNVLTNNSEHPPRVAYVCSLCSVTKLWALCLFLCSVIINVRETLNLLKQLCVLLH